jgi:hypothetical protein
MLNTSNTRHDARAGVSHAQTPKTITRAMDKLSDARGALLLDAESRANENEGRRLAFEQLLIKEQKQCRAAEDCASAAEDRARAAQRLTARYETDYLKWVQGGYDLA